MINNRIMLFVAIVSALLIAPAYATTTEVRSMDEPELFILSDSKNVDFLLVNPTNGPVSVTHFEISTQDASVELGPFIVEKGEIAKITVNISLPAELQVDSTLQYIYVDEPGVIGKALGSESEEFIVQKSISGNFALTPSGMYREDITPKNDFEIHESAVDIKIIEGIDVVGPSYLTERMVFVDDFLFGFEYSYGINIAEVHIFNPTAQDVVWNDMILFKKSHVSLHFSNPQDIPVELLPSGDRFWEVENFSEISLHPSYNHVQKKSEAEFIDLFLSALKWIIPLILLLLIATCIIWYVRYRKK